ncbi:MAG TPA: CPBP family intramembrane glutamic endopeptidase [Rubrobacteraceae bacterium]
MQEVNLRGIVFRITEERLGTWVALAISVVLFALLHLASPGATVIGAIVVGAEAASSSRPPTCLPGGCGSPSPHTLRVGLLPGRHLRHRERRERAVAR